MKNLIFSIYKPVDVDRKFTAKQTNTIKQFEKYFDKLISNKEEYAKLIGAEFKLVTPKESSFDNINFEKLFLLDKFADDYDNVLYLDLDVVINTNTSFFEKFNMNTLVSRYEKCSRYDRLGLECLLETLTDDNEELRKYVRSIKQKGRWEEFAKQHIDKHYDEAYSKLDKYHWLRKGQELKKILPIAEEWIINTAITGGSSETIKKLNLIDEYKTYTNWCNTHPSFKNNEIFLTYLIQKRKYPFTNLPEWWHHLCLKSKDTVANACMWHVVDKNFERVFKMQNFS